MVRRLGLVLHRVVLRTGRGPLRPLWSLGYAVLARGVTAAVTFGERGAGVYLRAAAARGDIVYGLSDLDMAIVVPDDAARRRMARRWERLCRVVPGFRDLFDLALYDQAVLDDAAATSILTYDLERADSPGPAYFGSDPVYDETSVRERPGLYGPLADWRLLRGVDRRPHLPDFEPQERRIAAWLELQRWWRYGFEACVNPAAPSVPYLSVKLVIEPVRIWLWLVHGERVLRRGDVLRRGLEVLPEEEMVLRQSLGVLGSLAGAREASLEALLPALVRMSTRIARRLSLEVSDEGSTDVALLGIDGPLVPVDSGLAPLRPLADWRALVWPSLPDETFALVDGDPADARTLAASLAGDVGPFPALRADKLLVLPMTKRGTLRSVQCALTDPVSFAIADDKGTAAFPDVRGWSARDWSRRAVAEHSAWLEARRDDAPLTIREWPDREARREPASVRSLGRLFGAARAALFFESVESGEPQLPLTVAATADLLADEDTMAAYEEYRVSRAGGQPPAAGTIAAFRTRVVGLAPYSRIGRIDPVRVQ